MFGFIVAASVTIKSDGMFVEEAYAHTLDYVDTTYVSTGDTLDLRIYFYDNFQTISTNQAVVMIHGGARGDREDKYPQFNALADSLNHHGYIAYYPERRTGTKATAKADVTNAAEFAANSYNTDAVGIMGCSWGNLGVLTFFQDYPGEADAYINLYGMIDEDWDHLDSLSIVEMIDPMLMQVGDDDTGPPIYGYQKCEALDDSITAYKVAAFDYTYTIYEDSDHGFFFNSNDTNSGIAWEEQIDFWDEWLQ